MKKLFKSSMLVAIVATALVGCSKDATSEIENLTPDNSVTVKFGATVEETRASLEPNDDETSFVASWEEGDQIGVYAYALDSNADGYTAKNMLGSRVDNAFETTFTGVPENVESAEYNAYYPYVRSTGASVMMPFGSERVQIGNKYNGQYDLMISEKVNIDGSSELGKDMAGMPIVFRMKRQTAIAYFHFTTTDQNIASEKLVSAKLTVTGDDIAAETIQVSYKETDNVIRLGAKTGGKKEITINFEGEGATAGDFAAWFNVLPGSFDSMTLELETENYTATVTRNGAGNYEAGKLYKVSVADRIRWNKKPNGVIYELVTDASLKAGDKVIIVCGTKNAAMSTKQESGYRGYAKIEIIGSTITNPTDNVQILTLEDAKDAGKFAFNTGSGYLCSTAAKSLTTISTISNDCSWEITIDKDNNASIVAGTDKKLQYNASSPRFTTYASAQTAVQIYRLRDDREPLAALEITKVTPNHETKSIVVEWNDVPNATSYTVSCTEQTDQEVDAGVGRCEFTVHEYGTYKITVTATAEGYRPSSASEDCEIIDYHLAAPSNIKATGTTTGITASWDKVANATSYEWTLYKGVDNSGEKIVVSENDSNLSIGDKSVSLTVSGEFEIGAQYVLYVKSVADAPFVGAEDRSEAFEIKDASAEPELVTYVVDFESATSAYTDWTFNNFTSSQTGSINAHGGTYYGTTGGKTTGYLQFNSLIAKPQKLTLFVSKQSNNTTSSNWKIQRSADGTNWVDIKTQSATSMSKGVWSEVSVDLSSYNDIYVRIYYTGSTAVRNIDDVTLVVEK